MRRRAPKKPIGCAKGRSSPVVFPAFTVAGMLMLPLLLQERVNVAFGGISVGPPIVLAKGVQDVSLRVPASLAKERVVAAVLRMSISYVPKQTGMNEDNRRLSVMLLRVRYR